MAEERLKEKISDRDETWLNLNSTLPIYLTYFTVVPDENGDLSFHEDIYEKNEDLLNALSNIN